MQLLAEASVANGIIHDDSKYVLPGTPISTNILELNKAVVGS